MSRWSRGRIALVGDAGYAVSLGTGQATSVAMVGAYVLAGELATHEDDLMGGLDAYEDNLRAYVTRNQTSRCSRTRSRTNRRTRGRLLPQAAFRTSGR